MLVEKNFNIIATSRYIETNSSILMELASQGADFEKIEAMTQKIISVSLDIYGKDSLNKLDIEEICFYIVGKGEYTSRIKNMIFEYIKESVYTKFLFEYFINAIFSNIRLRDIQIPS